MYSKYLYGCCLETEVDVPLMIISNFPFANCSTWDMICVVSSTTWCYHLEAHEKSQLCNAISYQMFPAES